MENIKNIAKKIEAEGGRLYLVGGAVRDQLLGKTVQDSDYCITGISQVEFEKLFPYANVRGKSFAVYDIEGNEFALARKETKYGHGHKQFNIETNKNISIKEDLARRDITINSIAQDVLTKKIIDPYGGIEDIKNRIIRATTTAFAEDPLRVYRVARFAATLQFQVEENTIEQMKKLKSELATLPKERVFQEFKKALASDKPSIFFDVLKKANVLDVHFKEIYNLIGKIQPIKYHPEGDSYNHTMIVLDNSTKLTKDLTIRFSCLLHDIGKGATPAEILPHHYEHEIRGEKIAEDFGKRIGAPKRWIQCAKIAAKEHMRGGKFADMTPKKQLEFIERVNKSPLGLEGMKIVVTCDKGRDGNWPEEVYFSELGKKCIKEINGVYVIKKYNLTEGEAIKQKLHEERINWLKKQTINWQEEKITLWYM